VVSSRPGCFTLGQRASSTINRADLVRGLNPDSTDVQLTAHRCTESCRCCPLPVPDFATMTGSNRSGGRQKMNFASGIWFSGVSCGDCGFKKLRITKTRLLCTQTFFLRWRGQRYIPEDKTLQRTEFELLCFVILTVILTTVICRTNKWHFF
jgi:hypothetical protein